MAGVCSKLVLRPSPDLAMAIGLIFVLGVMSDSFVNCKHRCDGIFADGSRCSDMVD